MMADREVGDGSGGADARVRGDDGRLTPGGCERSHHCQPGFLMTPEWHRAFAHLLRLLDDPKTRALARQHENVAKAIDRRRQE
jgi:hypothetical protein